MAISKKGWYEREEISKVTLDWVKMNCKTITDREMEILRYVSDRKLVSRRHLEIICPSFRHIGDNRSVIISKCIGKLFRKMCLDKAHEPAEMGKGSNPSVVALDRAGSMLLGIPHKKRIQQEVKDIKGKTFIFRKLPSIYHHINGINQLEVETILFCENNMTNISFWTVRDLDNVRSFHYGDEKVSVIPDVTTLLYMNERPIPMFIEFDTGKEDIKYKSEFPTLRDKLIKYRKYKVSEMWKQEDWQNALPHYLFPLLIFVTEDEKRIPYFEKKISEYGLEGFGMMSTDYTRFLEYLYDRL